MNKENYIMNFKNKEKLSKIIDESSKKYYEYSKWAKESIENSWDYEEFINYPIIQINKNLFLSIDENFIINKFFESLYYKIVDVCSGTKHRAKIITFLGRPFEKYIAIISEEAVKNNKIGFKFIDEFKYGKNDEKSSDAYIILEDAMIIVEAKSTRPVRSTFISEDEEKIEEAIIKLYSKPALQANNAYECIMKSEHRNKFDGINKIYIISVSLESVPYIRKVKQKSDLDIDVIRRLRNKVNEQQNISYRKTLGFKNKHISAWDKICAIMDRLDDTVDYLNNLELNTGKYSRSAFDFFDFMNNASVVVDCIEALAEIFNVSDDKIKKSINIFNEIGNKKKKGTDRKYFKYLRSLCSVHPVETSLYGGIYNFENNF